MLRRWMCAFMVVVLAAGLWYVAATTFNPLYGAISAEDLEVETDQNLDNTLTLWYTDDSLTSYLQGVALSFQQTQGVKVNLVLKSGVEFLEAINAVSIVDSADAGEAMPDLYITNHDNLLRAYLAGLADVVKDPENIISENNFPETSLRAVSCYGEHVAYPFYYETNYFLYNKTYMASIAQNKIESEIDAIEGAEAQKEAESKDEEELKKDNSEIKADSNNRKDSSEKADNEEEKNTVNDDSDDGKTDSSNNESDNNSDSEVDAGNGPDDEDAKDTEYEDPMGDEEATASAEVLERLSTMIPETLEDVTTFANNYDAPVGVESVLKWDVTDIFYNYFFVGNYMDVGGQNGDNAAVFNIYNQQAVKCLAKYQSMNQFFTIDPKVDTYERILQEFIDGKLVFTVATTDAVAKINEAKKAGKFDFEYGVTSMPDIDNLLKTKGLSVTDAVAINGYSGKKDMSNLLATYIVAGKADELYEKSGKVSCNLHVDYEDEEIYNIMAEYKNSVPLPKMVEAANYWVQLEIAFTKVWDGGNPDEILKELSDTIGAQIEELRIKIPTQETLKGGAMKVLW